MIRDVYFGSRIPDMICSISDPESRGKKEQRIRNAACHRSCLFEDRLYGAGLAVFLNNPLENFITPGYISQQKIWMTLLQQIYSDDMGKIFLKRDDSAGLNLVVHITKVDKIS